MIPEPLISSPPQSADVSFAIAVIPDGPICSQIAAASVEIALLTQNHNLIDNDRFPAHLSIVLSGASFRGITEVQNLMDTMPRQLLNAVATHVYEGTRGFIGVSVEGAMIDSFQEQLLPIVERVQTMGAVIRPHLLSRWDRLSRDERMSLLRWGTYKLRERFDKHLSVAQVDDTMVSKMVTIAKRRVLLPHEVTFRQVQLVDIGHRNEKWDIIKAWSM